MCVYLHQWLDSTQYIHNKNKTTANNKGMTKNHVMKRTELRNIYLILYCWVFLPLCTWIFWYCIRPPMLRKHDFCADICQVSVFVSMLLSFTVCTINVNFTKPYCPTPLPFKQQACTCSFIYSTHHSTLTHTHAHTQIQPLWLVLPKGICKSWHHSLHRHTDHINCSLYGGTTSQKHKWIHWSAQQILLCFVWAFACVAVCWVLEAKSVILQQCEIHIPVQISHSPKVCWIMWLKHCGTCSVCDIFLTLHVSSSSSFCFCL